MTKNYVRYSGKTSGPFSRDELRNLIASGKLGSLHQISEDKVSWWTREEWEIRHLEEENPQEPPAGTIPAKTSNVKASATVRLVPPREVAQGQQAKKITSPVSQGTPRMQSAPKAPKKLSELPASSRPSNTPKAEAFSKRVPLIGAGVLVLLLGVIILVLYDRSQRADAEDANRRSVASSIARAGELIESEDFTGAKAELEKAQHVASTYSFKQQLSEIAKLMSSPPIRLGANGFKKVDDQWLPAATVDAWLNARKTDDPIISQFETQARESLAAGRFDEAKTLVEQALRVIAGEPIQAHPEAPALALLKVQIQNAAVSQEMTAKGFILYDDKWVLPEEKFRQEQLKKGLVEYKGQWLTREAAFTQEQSDKGLVLYDGRWLTPDEKMQAQGFVQFEGKWITPSARDQIVSDRQRQEQQRQAAAQAELDRQKAAEAAQLAEQQRLDGLKETAYLMSQEFVKDMLKAPSTAQFQPYQARQVTVVVTKDGWFIVKAVVDAQNGFGAMIRNTYYSKLKPVAGDKWQSDSTFLDN